MASTRTNRRNFDNGSNDARLVSSRSKLALTLRFRAEAWNMHGTSSNHWLLLEPIVGSLVCLNL